MCVLCRDSCSIQSSVTVSCWQTSCLLTVWSLSSWTGCCLMSTWVCSHHTSPLYLKLVMSRWKYGSYYTWHPVGDNSVLFLTYFLGNFPNSLKANPRTLFYRQEARIADVFFLYVFFPQLRSHKVLGHGDNIRRSPFIGVDLKLTIENIKW